MLLQHNKSNKRGVSEVVGYVILIAIAIIISAAVFIWIKSYVPTDEIKCPDEVSIFISDYSCNLAAEPGKINLDVTIKNNGNFKIQGFFIKGTEYANRTIATYSLGQSREDYQEGALIIKEGVNPGKDYSYSFENVNRVYLLEIVPARIEEINNKKVFALCSQSKVVENLTCN